MFIHSSKFCRFGGNYGLATNNRITWRSSLQYYVVVILLHRPFLRSNDQGPLDGYNKLCWDAAGQVTAIMRAYRAHYSLVSPSY